MFKVFLGSLCLSAGLLAGSLLGLEMKVSPNVLVLKSPGQAVTVHTDVAYGDVLVDDDGVHVCSLSVNGVELAISTFADDCGNLVVRCSRADVAAALGDGAATADFSLTVETEDGSFSAVDTVVVKR